jgi:hypothetical protein
MNMRTDQAQSHWNTAYQSRPAEHHSWHQSAPERSLSMIAATGFVPAAPIIDIGGGASLLVDSLLARGCTDLTVLDISSEALKNSRARLGQRAVHVEWICTDIRDFQPLRSYSVWHDRALFHFLTREEDRVQYRRALRSGLAVGGCLLMGTFAIGGPLRCSGLDIVQYDEDRLLAALGPGFELQESQQEIHRTPGGGEQPFAWFRLKRI